MISLIVFIYQQQKCAFASVWTIFNSLIASELIIVEKVGGVTMYN